MYANESGGQLFPKLAPFCNMFGNGMLIFSALDAAAVYPEYLTDLNISQCPSDTGVDSGGMYVSGRLPDSDGFDEWIKAARDVGDRMSEDYFLNAELGRSYCYKGYVMTCVSEFYGVWGCLGARAPYGQATISNGIGTINLKDSTTDISLTEGAWPMPVDRARAQGTAGGTKVLKMKEGVERFLVTDINNPGASAQAQSTMPVMWDTFGSFGDSANTGGGAVFNHVPGGCNVLYMDGHASFTRYPSDFPIVNDPGVLLENSHFGLY
jgi:prepilin-type processing-associated H-X9-DG protein